MSPILKAKFLTGIEQLDSFTMDFHKMLGSSLMCNFLLLNHRKFWLKAFDSCALKRKQTLNEVRFFTISNSRLALIKPSG
jgi:glutamate/tyrosine decarboxylase-like PLP-dependent enzyme